MKEAHEHHARVRLTWLGALAVASGAIGLACGGRSVIFAAALASLPAAALIVLAYRRAQHSLRGELVAAVALPAVSMPVAVASGLAFAEAAALWLAWSVGYVASTIAVHRVLARHRHAATTVDWIIAVIFALMTAATVFLWDSVRVARVSLPFLAFTALVVAHPPRATRLRAIGVALVAVSLTALALATTAP